MPFVWLLAGLGLGLFIRNLMGGAQSSPPPTVMPVSTSPPETLPADFRALDSTFPMFPTEISGMSACPPGYIFGDAAELDRAARGPICIRADIAERVRQFIPQGRRGPIFTD